MAEPKTTTILSPNGNGGPWWVKALYAFGVPSVGLLYFIYWLTASHTAALDLHSHDQAHAIEGLTLIMRQVCANTAETTEERSACFRAPGDR
jgi:hypothetical protein